MCTLKLIFAFIIIFLGTAAAQKEVIELWPEGVPGSIFNPSYKTVTDSNQFWTWTKNISNPSIDFYPAQDGKSKSGAIIICPGGGYNLLAIKHEGSQIAIWLSSLGINAFVLKYRLPDTAIMVNKTIGPLQDAQKAIRIIRHNAKEWNIDPGKIGVMGFSAGGHLASTLSTHYNDKIYDSDDSTSARPDFSILIYPVISMDTTITHMGSRINLIGDNPDPELVKRYSNELQINDSTPPAFLVHSIDDNTVPVQNSIRYALTLKKHNIPCELHIYEKGGHGYGLGRSNDTESTWAEACKRWLRMHSIIH
jgi:acetyl esterase/lipase